MGHSSTAVLCGVFNWQPPLGSRCSENTFSLEAVTSETQIPATFNMTGRVSLRRVMAPASKLKRERATNCADTDNGYS
jgi:hypothetical protein